MGQQLSAKQYAPLSDVEQRVLREEAAERGVGNGMLTRVLVLHGLDHLGDPVIEARLDEEKAAAKERVSDGARAAARARWGRSEGKEDR